MHHCVRQINLQLYVYLELDVLLGSFQTRASPILEKFLMGEEQENYCATQICISLGINFTSAAFVKREAHFTYLWFINSCQNVAILEGRGEFKGCELLKERAMCCIL